MKTKENEYISCGNNLLELPLSSPAPRGRTRRMAFASDQRKMDNKKRDNSVKDLRIFQQQEG